MQKNSAKTGVVYTAFNYLVANRRCAPSSLGCGPSSQKNADKISKQTTASRTATGNVDHRAHRAWLVLTVTTVGTFLTATNASSLDVTLPAIARHFDASALQANWFMVSYMLTNTALILSLGWLGDVRGRRAVYIGGIIVFMCASALCAVAPTPVIFIIARTVQGAGAAGIITTTTALLTDVFPPRILGIGLGLNVTIFAASLTCGPLIGGAMVGHFGWNASFIFNIPIGTIDLVWALAVLRSTPKLHSRQHFDWWGGGLSGLALGGITLGFSYCGAYGCTSPSTVVSFVVAAVSATVFIRRQRTQKQPLVDLELFSDRERSFAYLAMFLMAISYFSIVLLISLFMQAVCGLDGFQAAFRVAPLAGGMMIASPIAGRLTARCSARSLTSGGFGFAAVGILMLTITLQPTMNDLTVVAILLCIGLGVGLFMTPNTSSIMSTVRPDRRGIANGVRSALQYTGFLVSTGISLAVVTSGLSGYAKPAAYAGTLSRLTSGDLSAFISSCKAALLMLFVLCVIGAIASLLRGTPAKAHEN